VATVAGMATLQYALAGSLAMGLRGQHRVAVQHVPVLGRRA
jgi:hypothetical protein